MIMKRKFLPVVLIIAVFSGLCEIVNGQGGTLPLNNSVTGSLTSATPDIWDVTTTSDGLLRLTFSTTSPADLFLTLYDNDGVTAISGTVESFNNSTVTISADGLAPGTYHAKIVPFSTSFGAYVLADSLFVPALANDAGPNGNRTSAVTITQNGSTTGHVGFYYNNLRDTTDWFKVTTTADGLLRIYLSSERSSIYSSNTLDVNVTLYDNDGTTQLGFMEVFNGNGPGSNIITTDGLAPGTYYVKVQPFSTSEFAVYTLSDSLILPSIVTDAEPNGSRSSALVLPLTGSASGHLGYYYNNLRDTADWYKVTTNADGLLRVYINTTRGSVYSNNPLDVNVTLYDNDGSTQLGLVEAFNGNGPATGLITTDGLAPGTYYLKVQPFSANEFANYTLSDSLILTPVLTDAEPNGTAATAIAIPLNATSTGHAGYFYNNQRDTTDWYKLTTPAAAFLHLYLNTQRGSVYSNNPLDMMLTLYNSDGVTQAGSVEAFNGNGPASAQLNFASIPAGTYFIKITNFSASEFANYTLVDSSGAGPLPVTLVDFTGSISGNQALLHWSTAAEINNKGFEVEKSMDGQTFTGIGFADGSGTSSLKNNYSFIDTKVLSGANYYRLKQVDMDGNFTYSFTIRLNYKNFNWKVVGNPLTGNSRIQLQLANTSVVAIQLISMDGKVLQSAHLGAVSEGTISIALNTGNLPRGTYVLRLMVNDQSFSKTIIK